MATRKQITEACGGVADKLYLLPAIYDAIKDSQDSIIYINNNPKLPVTVKAADRQTFQANFDAIVEEIKVIVAGW